MATVSKELANIIFGELDNVVSRIEKLPADVEAAADKMDRSADLFKAAISEYTEQVKRDLESHANLTLANTKAQAASDLKIILESESRQVFQEYAFREVEKLLQAQRSAKPAPMPQGEAFNRLAVTLALVAGVLLGVIGAAAWLR